MNLTPTIIGLALATGMAAAAQETHPSRQPDYSAFRIISQQNIFNQFRVARRRAPGQPAVTVPVRIGDAFSLVGTMSYGKGDFAFFDGTNAEYRKIVRPEGAIADYKVTEITAHGVKLESNGQQIEMTVGTHVRRDSQGVWQLVTAGDLPGTAAGSAVAQPGEPAGGSSSGNVNDVLKKLMQQREQELK